MGETTGLEKTPFCMLGVSVHDTRQRIAERADETALSLDPDRCQQARSDLINPRTRLGAEVAWLPGIAPSRVVELLADLRVPTTGRQAFVAPSARLPVLALLNWLASRFEAQAGLISNAKQSDTALPAAELARAIQRFASLAHTLSAAAVQQEVNADRAVSGFPEVRTLEPVEVELRERQRVYRDAIKGILDQIPTDSLVQVVTEVVEAATAKGVTTAPALVDDLVDYYEVEAQDFMAREGENVRTLIRAVRGLLRDMPNAHQEGAVAICVDQLAMVTRNWGRVVQPIQWSARARGLAHRPSQELAWDIRALGIELFNKHDQLAIARRIAELLQEAFADVPGVTDQLVEDAATLADIDRQRAETAASREQCLHEIAFRAEVGVLFKDVLSISADGVAWKTVSYPLASIARVRWGGTRHSINGIPTGTVYTVAFGDYQSEAVVELRKESVYTEFTGKLWKAVCGRLLEDMVKTLGTGTSLRFGDMIVHDDGITLLRRKFIGTESVRCSWNQIEIWSQGGALHVQAKGNTKVRGASSYINVANTHVLEQAIRLNFEQVGLEKLSQLLA